MEFYLVDDKKLRGLCADIFQREGLDAASAADVAGMLISADLRGVRGHGVIRVKKYLDRLSGGGANKTADMRVVRETPVTAVIDADNGLGGVASGHLAVRLARANGGTSRLRHGFGAQLLTTSAWRATGRWRWPGRT